MRATVLGASGFIGRALCAELRQHGVEPATPGRAELSALVADGAELGTVFYCIGMTGQFRRLPRETVQAQAGLLADVLFRCRFDSLVYLSSTRVYGTDLRGGPCTEDQPIPVRPHADATYDLSKLLGEALCAAHGGRVISARLSNVYGPGMSTETFLGSVLSSLARDGQVEIGEHPDSAKDYLSIADATAALVALARHAPAGCYNLASGTATPHSEIAAHLRRSGHDVRFRDDGPLRRFPPISIDKLRAACSFAPRAVIDDLDGLVSSFPTRNRQDFQGAEHG